VKKEQGYIGAEVKGPQSAAESGGISRITVYPSGEGAKGSRRGR